MNYDNNHRFLLRLISSQSMMSLADIQNLVATKAGDETVNIRNMVKLINEKIKPFHQMIKIVKNEVTAEDMVVFLAVDCDQTNKVQNVFTALELEFFRVLIEQIMTTETREITEISAINAVNNIKINNRRLGKEDAHRLLSTWCRMGYLEKEDGNFALGVRGIHEFESYLCTNMSDTIEKCCICSNIVFRGYNCPTCAEAIHNRCLQVCLGKTQRWPCCKTVYNNSQLQQLRGQRLNLSSRMGTQNSETTQVDNNTTAEESTQEMDTEEASTSTVNRGRKRKRLDS